MDKNYVLIFVHKEQTTQLPIPPAQETRSKWTLNDLFVFPIQSVALYLLEKSFRRLM